MRSRSLFTVVFPLLLGTSAAPGGTVVVEPVIYRAQAAGNLTGSIIGPWSLDFAFSIPPLLPPGAASTMAITDASFTYPGEALVFHETSPSNIVQLGNSAPGALPNDIISFTLRFRSLTDPANTNAAISMQLQDDQNLVIGNDGFITPSSRDGFSGVFTNFTIFAEGNIQLAIVEVTDLSIAPVPEPGTMLLLLPGLAALARRRRPAEGVSRPHSGAT